MERQQNERENETEETSISVESFISKYDIKLKFYAEECEKYAIEKIKIIQQCLEETLIDCNLQNYLIGSTQCYIMFEAFRHTPISRLTSINLKRNFLDCFCFNSMASFIRESDTLQELNIESCNIRDKGIEVLAPALATSVSIIQLNLKDNHISDDGGEILFSFLYKNSTIVDLNVSYNQLSIKTARIIGKMLMQNEILKKLDLSHNFFHEQFAAIEIMKGNSKNEYLEFLDLSWNGLYGDEFGKTLSKHLRKSGLKIFKLEHNRLTSFCYQKLAIGIKYSEAIQEIYIGFNIFQPDDDVTLMKVFKTDTPLQLLSFGDSFHLSHEAYGMMKDLKLSKPSIQVIYRGLQLPNPPREVCMLDIFSDRAKFLAMKPKQKRLRRDMRVFMIKLRNLESRFILKADLIKLFNAFNAKLDTKLVEQYIEACRANDRLPIIDAHMMANHYLNRHRHHPNESKK
ncbi:hypothetical protein PVAND_001108 [Polypedilum vanderplanki]|uniref:Uncharacterized protein n=1 Tax=Polypedilum vanderplanki TaxID=319348 RepID=A0A9J6BLY6_POLVA|nr:hypothetical protein PVAND_001108 [Polypedilum vanderplanki]